MSATTKSSIVCALFLLLSATSLAACSDASVGDPDPIDPIIDPDICGELASCAGECVDTKEDPQHCGGCTNACRQDEMCVGSTCACAAGEVDCNGKCINPASDIGFCGADAACLGFTACGTNEVCVARECRSTVTFVGSLTTSLGRWNFQNSIGLTGAANACVEAFGAGMALCSLDELMVAQGKGELVNAVDTAGNAVTSWWVDAAEPAGACANIDGVARPGCLRCQNFQTENIPWSYSSAHLNMQGRFVTLDAAAGTVSALTTGACSASRSIACCNPNAVTPAPPQ